MKRILLLVTNVLFIAVTAHCFATESFRGVTLGSLLKEMTSRETLARWPENEFNLKQMSSYDRMSISPDRPGWFANFDLSTFLRVDSVKGRREFVMFDQSGPGAVVRFWMTFAGIHPGEGTMRVYIDNSEEPVVQGSPFDILSGGMLAPEPLSASVSKDYRYDRRGHNLYLPIPYAKRCIITYESVNVKESDAGFGGENVYYNINYREYLPDIKVVSFSKEQLKLYSKQIKECSKLLSMPLSDVVTTDKGVYRHIKLDKGGQYYQKFRGEAAISHMSVKLENGSTDNNFSLNQALRSVLIEIWFDGKRCVWSPVGDFFGTGYKISPHSTFYTNVHEDGRMESYWIMPFKESAEIKIINHYNREVAITLEVLKSEWRWDDASMHFHASWREFNRLDAGGVKSNNLLGEGAFDVNYVEISGRGVFAGDALTLYNSAYAWWGEGDEKIYVDRESFPSNFGTGTEDYYGYAWCRPEKFTDHPFISQPDGSGNLEAGYTVNLRYRALDKLPFREHLKFDMEVWTWTDAILNFSPVTYFYLLPEVKSEIFFPDNTGTLITAEGGAEVEVVTDRRQLVTAAIKKGVIEFDQLHFVTKSNGRVSFDRSVNFETSNKAFVNWSGAGYGDTMVVKFYSESEKPFNKMVIAYVCGRNFGKFKISINGKESDQEIDSYSTVPLVKEIEISGFESVKGENTIIISHMGKSNPEQTNSFVGIDYLRK